MIDAALYVSGARMETQTPARNVTFSHDRHGAASAFALFPGTLKSAFQLRNRQGIMELVISEGARTLWRGRVEDRAMTENGLSVSAFGYSRTFYDAPYTALWSVSTSAGWRNATSEEIPVAANGRYTNDNNNRIKIAVNKNAETSLAARGVMVYELPDRGARNLATISFSYDATAFDGAAYLAALRGYDDNWNQLEETTIVTTRLSINNVFSYTFTNQNITKVAILWSRDSNTAQLYTDETDVTAVFIATNIRLKSAQTSKILSSQIASALYDYINALNPGLLRGKMITATTTDLRSELYEDETPASILNYLAKRERYDWGVDANRVFYFRPRGQVSRIWYIEADSFSIQESIENLTNSVYAIHRSAAGRTLRTAIASNAQSVRSYGLTRRAYISAETTSASEAAVWRDAALTDGVAGVLRATVNIKRVVDRGGAERPAYHMQPGDKMVITNLPQTLSADIDNISEIEIARTEYDTETMTIAAESDSPMPTLVTLIARSK